MSIDSLPVLINGVAKSHADLNFVIDTLPIIGVTALNYADPQEITPNFSNANKATSVGFGKVEPNGSVTMQIESVEQIQALAASRGGRIQNLPFFEITVAWDSDEGGIFIVHRLKSCKFKGRSVDSNVDNSQIEETLELFIGDIEYNTL